MCIFWQIYSVLIGPPAHEPEDEFVNIIDNKLFTFDFDKTEELFFF